MGRVLRVIGVAALTLTVMATPGAQAAVAASSSTAVPASATSPVVVLLAPYLTWEDIDLARTPTLARLAEEGALGSVAVRGGIRPGVVPDDLRGAAVMSAGQHVAAPTAADLGDPESPYGLLGGAVADARGTTVAVGSGATSLDGVGKPAESGAYIVAMDTRGEVDVALIDKRLLADAALAPLGITADLEAYERLLGPLFSSSAHDTSRPTLIVLDPGDGARARTAAEQGGSWDVLRQAAARTTDQLAATVLDSLPADGTLIVVSTAQYEPGEVEGFGPLIVHGRGSGVLYSSRTRLEGVVALPDVSATVLQALGAEIPDGMVGAPLELRDVPAQDASALATMRRIDRTARAFDAPRMPVYYGFIGLCLAALLLGMIVMMLPALRAKRRLRRVLAVLVLVCLSVPLGTSIAQIAGYPSTASSAWLRLGLGTALVAVVTLVVAHKRGFVGAVGMIATTTAAVIVVDQLVGAPLAYGGIFSYTPLAGTRYYGIGNEGAAVLVAAGMIAASLGAGIRGVVRPWVILAVGAIVVAVAVAPFAGANIGVAAWGSVGFLTCWAYRARRTITWRMALAGLLLVVALVAVAVLVDSVSGAQSHLGQAIYALLGDGGVQELLGRKIAMNVEALTTTPLVILLPIIMAALAYALARPRGWVGAFVEKHRGLAAALAGALAAALVGAFSEDSGVSVSAIVLLYGLGAPLVVALADAPEVVT